MIAAHQAETRQLPHVPLPPGSALDGEIAESTWRPIGNADPIRGERVVNHDAIRLALTMSGRGDATVSDDDPSDDELSIVSDEDDGWRDRQEGLTEDELYMGAARPVELTTSDDRTHHTCSVCLQVKSHPVVYVAFVQLG